MGSGGGAVMVAGGTPAGGLVVAGLVVPVVGQATRYWYFRKMVPERTRMCWDALAERHGWMMS